jgi:hypothetical protein
MSSPVSTLPTVALAHSVNSSGRLGLYVDPCACSCATCTEYCAERTESVPFGPQATEPALSSTTLEDMYREMRAGPAPAPAPVELLGSHRFSVADEAAGAGAGSVALGPAPANHLWTGCDWVHQDSPYARSVAMARELDPPSSYMPARLPAPALFRVGLGLPPAIYRHEWVYPGASLASASPAPAEEPAPLARSSSASIPQLSEEDLMHALRYLRADLQLKQDGLYVGITDPHADTSPQDAEYRELDRKIHSIEQMLTAFGSFYRTR